MLGSVIAFGILPPKELFYIKTPIFETTYGAAKDIEKTIFDAKQFGKEYFQAIKKDVWKKEFAKRCTSYDSWHAALAKEYKKKYGEDLPKLRSEVNEKKDNFREIESFVGNQIKVYVKLSTEYQESIYNACCISDGTLVNIGPRVAVFLNAKSKVKPEELSRARIGRKDSNDMFTVEKEALTT